MITRALFVFAAGIALAACQPAIPDSGRGVGFNDSFQEERRQRDAALEGTSANVTTVVPPPPTIAAAPLDDGSPEATAAETTRILAATRPGAAAPAAIPGAAVVNSAGISDENNFDAVSGERSIEGDAARLAANRAQYEVVQPEALPLRRNLGPNVVAYALETQHAPGTQLYNRIGFNKEAKSQRACAQYANPDQAQIAFLEAGGPEKDRKGVDPDGDGFACGWDPTPFRRAARG